METSQKEIRMNQKEMAGIKNESRKCVGESQTKVLKQEEWLKKRVNGCRWQ